MHGHRLLGRRVHFTDRHEDGGTAKFQRNYRAKKGGLLLAFSYHSIESDQFWSFSSRNQSKTAYYQIQAMITP